MRGSKIRAPISGKTELCQHMTSRRHNGIELIMECQHCDGGSLSNIGCYQGVLRAIQVEGVPAAIILRSHIEKRHDSRSTRVMSLAAEILNSTEELRSQLVMDSKRNEKCSGCLKLLIVGLDSLEKSILSRKVHMALKHANVLEKHDFRQGSKCDECAGMSRVQLSSLSRMANALEKEILVGAFNIVKVSE
ncbi:MAG: hypothetical protein KAR56_03820 [Thermoplasmata archaeon]|nr:hypothetical protein [Thermoplasmata archaeon]